MAFSLGSLVQTAGQAVDKHRQLQRQHDQDILQRALITAQIGELSGRHGPQGFTLPAGATRYGPDGKLVVSAPAAVKPPPRLVDPVNGTIWERNENGEWQQGTMASPTTPSPTPQPPPTTQGPASPAPASTQRPASPPVVRKPARLGVPQQSHMGTDAQGNAVVATTDRAGHVTGVQTVGGGMGKASNANEREIGSLGDSMQRSVNVLQDVATHNPQAFAQAMAWIRAQRHGRIPRMLAEARGVLGSDDANRVVQEYSNFLLTSNKTVAGTRPTEFLVELEQNASLPAFGQDQNTWGNAFQAMKDRVATARAKAGTRVPSNVSADSTAQNRSRYGYSKP